MLVSVDLITLGIHELTYEAVAIEIKDTKDKDIVSMNYSPEKAPLSIKVNSKHSHRPGGVL